MRDSDTQGGNTVTARITVVDCYGDYNEEFSDLESAIEYVDFENPHSNWEYFLDLDSGEEYPLPEGYHEDV